MKNGTVGNVLKSRYEIIAELGRGGMSTVYLARDLKLESYWAVKRVRNDNSVDIDAFKMEVELLSGLNHSDIPRIVDRIETENDYFVIMDFIDGVSLKRKVQSEGVQQEEEIVEWAKMLCDILIYLHTVRTNPIIYRDMKPDNIMLTQNGRVKLIDFGIAKECKRGEKQPGIGTQGYAAPEQYASGSNILDERTDIYSLGATLYYLATAQRPDNPPNGVKAADSVNPKISEGLKYIIYKCTRDNPEERYLNCYELKEDLNNIKKMTRDYRRQMRKRLLSFVMCVCLCLVFVVFAVVGHGGIEKNRRNSYLYHYNLAETADRNGDYDTAAKEYLNAISFDGSKTETYMEYFDALVPQEEEQRYEEKLESAINIIRNSYLDNSKSKMYQNPELMYAVSKKCLELTDAGYIAYASDYLNVLSEKNYTAEDLLGYKIIAQNLSQNLSEIDFKELCKGLEELENVTDSRIMESDGKLNNYYILMKAYSQYPVYISQEKESETYAYDKIAQIGQKARNILEESASEEIHFSGIIKLHELVASGMCSKAAYLEEKKEKCDAYMAALIWFGYLEDYGVEPDTTLQLKKANAYLGVYENTDKNENGIQNLENAINEYKELIKKDNSDFTASVYLTEALLKREQIKDKAAADYGQVIMNYEKVEVMYNSLKDKLSNADITRYSSLKQQMANAGLEVTG